MGVVKLWMFSFTLPNLALLKQQNGYNGKHMFWRLCNTTTTQQRKQVSWTLVCGLMLFALGLISLFTGHVASDLEWYSQRFAKLKHGLYTKVDIFSFYCYFAFLLSF